MLKNKQTYEVTLYFHTNATIKVEAESMEEAVEIARNSNLDEQILSGLQEDDAPDVKALGKLITIFYSGEKVEVTPENIISVFQDVCKTYIDSTEDAGCGMRNIYLDDVTIQIYPDDSVHNVFINEYSSKYNITVGHELNSYAWCIQTLLLKEFVETLKPSWED